MGKVAKRVFIEGRVQGVFFRAYTQEAALQFGVTGWVRNLPDRRVEALLEGEEEQVQRMIAWCYKGSPASRVERVIVEEIPYSGKYANFRITY